MDMSGIKNIVFDLGGVILNIDHEATIQAFEKLGVTNIRSIYSSLSQDSVFDELEKGMISPSEFRDRIRSKAGLNIPDGQFDEAWNAILQDFPKERIALLTQLKKQYRIFLLSNTNIIHFEKYNRDFILQFGMGLKEIFEKAYLSFEMGMRKPDTEIFSFVLKDACLSPQETLFLDDSSRHIASAEKLGIRAHLIQGKETLTSFFNRALEV